MTQIIDGALVAKQIRQKIKDTVNMLKLANMRSPGLAVVLIGDDPASHIYVKNKRKACEEVGFYSTISQLRSDTTMGEVIKLIKNLNNDRQIDGILVQLPLPPHLDTQLIIEAISPLKDVDGFHPYNVGRLLQRVPVLTSCTPKGIMSLLHHYQITLEGKHAVIVGQSNIVGRPMMLELLMAKCTTTLCHSATKNLKGHIAQADILVVAIGKANFISGKWIKKDAVVIDVGINRINAEDGKSKLVGDVNFEQALENSSYITPVPGGVGPMTVASLMQNTLLAYNVVQKNIANIH